MVNINKADEKDLNQMKAWFFKENIRIQQEKQQLEEERNIFEREKKKALQDIDQQKMVARIAEQHLQKEKELFNKKFEILERELRQLANDRQQLEKEKEVLKELKRRQTMNTTSTPTPRLFFKGVNNETSLKKRYRDLLKIFHPDNLNGDTDAIQNINKEYDSLKKIYCI